jgi:hypothetical protein
MVQSTNHRLDRILREASMNTLPTPELPKYLCHKEVRALKIKEVRREGGQYLLHFTEEGYPPIRVETAWVDKFGPTRGSYYVVYNDGYASVSPAKAFEEGYTRVQEKLPHGTSL